MRGDDLFREMLVINEKILPGVQNSLLKRERGSLYLISTHRQWITVFSLQIRAAFKDIMSISCLFFSSPQQEAPVPCG